MKSKLLRMVGPGALIACARGRQMTLADALEIARHAKPLRRQPLDKLHASTTAAQLSAGANTLNKSFDALGGTLAKARAQVDQIAADVEYIQTFTPGQPPRRLQ